MSTERHSSAPTAVLLFSGGLDSILSAEVLRRAGVEVILLRHHSIFFPLKEGSYVPPCRCIVREVSEEMVRLVREPEYGFGKNVNPCLDCKQMMYGKAMAEAGRLGADFIATGEVLGQRPMSQRRDAFRRMEKGAGVVDMVVRPLSGRLLPPAIPEQRGLIDREDLLDFQGRSRKRHMALAEQWGIEHYPSPAGGCRLTDPHFAERVEALREMGYAEMEHLRAVRHGRFFVLGERTYALVGRNHEDNLALAADAPPGCRMLDLDGRPGPLAALAGESDEQQLEEARRLVIRYSRFGDLPASEVLVESPEQCRRRKAAGEGP